MAKVGRRKSWNPSGSDDFADMWGADTTGILNLNNIRYKSVHNAGKQIQDNFWVPDKTDMSQDITDWHTLLEPEKKAFKGIMSYLSFLDSLQGSNLVLLQGPFTSPEAIVALGKQIQQEGLHVESYQYVMQALFPPEEIDDIYDFWRTDDVLRERCGYIADIYQRFADTEEDSDYFLSLVASYLLEGLYFMNGFQFFYNLAYKNKMGNTSSIFAYINRDEITHIFLFQNFINEAIAGSYFPYVTSDIYDLFEEAVKQEIAWTNHICGSDILGITEETTRKYTEYLANTRLKAIGLKPIFENQENPYRHLAKIGDVGSEAHSKANYFETTVTAYNLSSAFDGWGEM